ncbi:MAG: hypothetical protein U1E52_07360 [Geminicoccaceae bacterium]
MRAVWRNAEPGRALPLGDVPAGGTLAILTAAVVCLAVLALAVASGARAQLERLEAEPRQLTVALPPPSGAPDAAMLERVVEAIRRIPGMVELREVPPTELQTLVPAGLLEGVGGAGVTLPRLLEVGFESRSTPRPDDLVARLAAVAPGITVGAPDDDAAAQTSDSLRTMRLGWLGGGLCLAGLVLGVALVARWALGAQAEGVRLLRALGANDAHISRQFEEHAARAALIGAGAGFLAALSVLAALALAGRIWLAVGPVEPRLTPADWLHLAAVPVAGGLLAGWVAKLTVRIGLARLR